jgi:heat shock protein HslJ
MMAGGNSIPPVLWELKQMATGDQVVTPDNPGSYTIQFLPDNLVAIGADCNRAGGTYTIDGSSLTMSDLFSTLALCGPESISDQYLANIQDVASFTIAGDLEDELVLSLKADGGQLNYAPTLYGVTWQWIDIVVNGAPTVTAGDPSRYTIIFNADNSLTVKADCNVGFGEAKIEGNTIQLLVATTRKLCTDSQDGDFTAALSNTTTFAIKDGLLQIDLANNAGIARFMPFVE